MAQYLIRRGKFSNELAKFEDSDYPTDVYTIGDRGCSCPSRYRACKHTRIVAAWTKAGSPEGVVLDDDASIIGNIFEWTI